MGSRLNVRYSVTFSEISFYLECSVVLNTNNTSISNDIKNNGQKLVGRVGSLTHPSH